MDGAAHFLLPPAGSYFLSHSVGLRPKAADAAESQFSAPWARGDARVWDAWLAVLGAWRAKLGALLGAAPDDLCPQTNISSALTKILFSLPERRGRSRIVLCEDDFPTIGFVADQARRAGYVVEFIPGGPALADPDAWSRMAGDDVQLALVTHVFSNSALRAPIAEIVRRARDRGVFVVLDVAQSAGAVPLDLGAVRPDFAVGTSVKYLCGGPGAAFLYADADATARAAPVDVGWFSHEDPFEFDIRRFRYARGAARFWGGTPSVTPYATAIAGLDGLSAFGLTAVAEHNQSLIQRLVDGLGPARFLSETRAGVRGASVILRVRDIETATAALSARGLAHDQRRGGVRASVHLYTQETDVDALIEAARPFV